MTDNPTPNEIALLREALSKRITKIIDDRIAYFRRTKGHVDREDFARSYSATREEILTAIAATLAPGQHDGAAGEGLTTPAGKMTHTLAYAFVGKLKQSEKADVSERLGIRLDYSLPGLERDKRFLQAVVDAGAVNFLEAALASLLPMDFKPKPSTEQARAEKLVTLAECPPGPFLFSGRLGFKTEYGMTLPVPDDNGGRWEVTNRPDAYVMVSGECFWGGAKTHDERAALMVLPVDVAAAGADALGDRL